MQRITYANPDPTVSIVIPTFNRAESVAETVQRCLTQTYPGNLVEIIVIDDGGSDHTGKKIEKIQAGAENKIVFVRHEQNQGLAKARNTGIAASGGELILFIDDDVAPSRFLVERHVDFHHEYPWCVSQGLILPARETSLPDELVWKQRFSDKHLHGADFEFAIVGANFSAWKADLARVGGFDGELKYYEFEDTDIGFRFMKNLGLHARLNRKAVVCHRKIIAMEEWARTQWKTGGSFIRWFRKQPDILDNRYSKQMCKTFRDWLKGVESFSPFTRIEYRQIFERIRNLEQKYDANPEPSLKEELFAQYRKIFSHCFYEGASQEANTIRSDGPSFLN